MRFLWGFLAAILIVVIVVIIFGIDSIRGGAIEEPPAYQSAVINQVKLWFIPEAREVLPPPEKTREALLEGGEHFNHHCAVCHDLSGDADSLLAESFHPQVTDLTDDVVQAYSDEQLKWITDNGIRYTGMPGWAKLIDDDVQWKIVYYMRVLGDPDQKGNYEEMLKERGLWKIGLPVGEHEHEEEPGRQPSEQQPSEQQPAAPSQQEPVPERDHSHEQETDDHEH